MPMPSTPHHFTPQHPHTTPALNHTLTNQPCFLPVPPPPISFRFSPFLTHHTCSRSSSNSFLWPQNSKLYGVNATIKIFVFVLYCISTPQNVHNHLSLFLSFTYFSFNLSTGFLNSSTPLFQPLNLPPLLTISLPSHHLLQPYNHHHHLLQPSNHHHHLFQPSNHHHHLLQPSNHHHHLL